MGIHIQEIDIIDTHEVTNFIFLPDYYTPHNEVRGGILDSPCLSLCLSVSVCLSVCLSVCPLTFSVRPVASTVQDGFFPYLVQMMRGCVTCDDP